MTELEPYFAYCIKKFGPPIGGETVPASIAETYRTRVPDSMIEFWKKFGVGLWLAGRFQLVRPDRYQGLIDMILEGDPDFPPEQCALIGYSAFGQLLIWNNRNYVLDVDLVGKESYTDHVNPSHPVLSPNKDLPQALSNVDQDSYDYPEHTDAAKPLFTRAMKKCGKLAHGECYGFVPAIGLGGRGVLDEVQRVRALEHFSIIAQLQPIELRYMDTDNRKIVVLRELGG